MAKTDDLQFDVFLLYNVCFHTKNEGGSYMTARTHGSFFLWILYPMMGAVMLFMLTFVQQLCILFPGFIKKKQYE